MPNSTSLIREKLKTCNLPALFIEELGWNHHRAAPLVVPTDGVNYVLNAIAEKHGMVAYECQPGPAGQIPDYPARGKIERQVAKSAHEHIIVFINRDRTMQTWQWVRREKGKPAARREHTYVCAQPGDSLIQKLQNLMVSLDEEEKLTIVDVTGKARQAFDVDHVTKRFYDRFKEEHKDFLSFIDGITAVADREWYASLMLNRLMFIYFIQKKGFLDGDDQYLRNRLQMVQQSQGKGNFHTFYRYFLRRLFHEGLAQRKDERKAELNTLLGNVPYLNGGLFDTHQLEKDNPDIQIPDEAFEKLFDFFDAYQWHLDERPTRADNEINPDVLGYIFEKYINQKQMGAYYTKEDITEYISKSTIVPFLFDAAEKKCAIAFRPEGAVWRLLRDDPDRYIYDAVKKGIDLPLPGDIAAGISEVSKRGGWNRPADEAFALPTETWREHVARRTRCLEVRAKLAAGEIHNINDLITYNLYLRQFAQDVIETCEGPELLRAIYQSITEVSVLDPTCGSGAFLFAALNILEPLYEACLERMEVFVEELDKSEEKHHSEKFSDFRKVLEQANDRTRHPSRRYFILKSIVLKNLYGVDIMAEAVEICKLRLFLKLVAQVERVEDVEPLPDIDFNIRAGNTLVGFASIDSVRRAITIRPDGRYRMVMPEDEAALKRIDESAELADKAFRRFREQQTDYGMQTNQYSAAKGDLQTRLAALRTELDRYLATEYGIDLRKQADFERWRSSHQPFHWFVEYYGILKEGGFDVVIGNPPYLERKQVNYAVRDYKTTGSGAIHAFCMERSSQLLKDTGSMSMIVPMAIVSTQRMEVVQRILDDSRALWYSNYSWRPGKLFDTVNRALTIFVAAHSRNGETFSTGYQKWISEDRSLLMQRINYAQVPGRRMSFWIPKIGSNIEVGLITKVATVKPNLGGLIKKNGDRIYYRTTGGLYWKVFTDFAPAFKLDGVAGHSSRETWFTVSDKNTLKICIAILSSSLYWWWYTLSSNLRDLNPSDLNNFPVPESVLSDRSLCVLGDEYLADLKRNSRVLVRHQKQTGTTESQLFKVVMSKPIIDKIDIALSRHYELSFEELDFVINYDIKYRMGGADSDDGDE